MKHFIITLSLILFSFSGYATTSHYTPYSDGFGLLNQQREKLRDMIYNADILIKVSKDKRKRARMKFEELKNSDAQAAASWGTSDSHFSNVIRDLESQVQKLTQLKQHTERLMNHYHGKAR